MRERRANLTGGPHALPVCSHAPSLASLGPERGLRRHRVRRGGVDAPDGGHPRTRLHHPFGNGPGGILMSSSGFAPRLLAASLYSVGGRRSAGWPARIRRSEVLGSQPDRRRGRRRGLLPVDRGGVVEPFLWTRGFKAPQDRFGRPAGFL